MNTMIRKFLAEEDGITAIEYGVLAAIVAAAIVYAFGTPLRNFFSALLTSIETAAGVTVPAG